MTHLLANVEVFRKGITIVFSQMLWFKIEKQEIQMQEKVLIKRIQELQDEEDGSKISSGQMLSSGGKILRCHLRKN